MISHRELLDRCHYDHLTGIFTWKKNYHAWRVGRRMGCVKCDGYRVIHIGDEYYYSANLAWFYMTGTWSATLIDHKNTIRDDDRWENLREATRGQNQANMNKTRLNTSGYKGVFRGNAGKWRANIKVRNIGYALGSFPSKEAAARAYDAAARKFHGRFARCNFPDEVAHE